MALNKDEKQILVEIRTDQKTMLVAQTEFKTVLLGTNGQGGLVREVKSHNKKINRLELVIIGMVSSGFLGGSIMGLIKWLGN